MKNSEIADDTIKNDSSFDEFSISEKRASNHINKNNSNINDNNILFSKNGYKKNDFIKKIMKEETFNYSLNLHHKGNSYDFLKTKYILNDELLFIKISKVFRKEPGDMLTEKLIYIMMRLRIFICIFRRYLLYWQNII